MMAGLKGKNKRVKKEHTHTHTNIMKIDVVMGYKLDYKKLLVEYYFLGVVTRSCW